MQAFFGDTGSDAAAADAAVQAAVEAAAEAAATPLAGEIPAELWSPHLFHAFPTLASLRGASEERLRQLGLGYRAKVDRCKTVVQVDRCEIAAAGRQVATRASRSPL